MKNLLKTLLEKSINLEAKIIARNIKLVHQIEHLPLGGESFITLKITKTTLLTTQHAT